MSSDEVDLESATGPASSRTPPPQLLQVELDEVAPLSPDLRTPTKRSKTTSISKTSDTQLGSPTSPGDAAGEKRASFFLPLFGRKHHHQSSSENLPSKAAGTKEKTEKEKDLTKPQKEKIGPSGDPLAPLSFPYNLFSRFFHPSKTVTTPVSPPPQEKDVNEEKQPNEYSVGHIESSAASASGDLSQECEEADEGEELPGSEPPIEFTAGRAASEEADERQSSQQSLLSLLEEFRSGNMRALSDESLEMLREMHRQQLGLHRLHVSLHQREPKPLESSEELDSEFDRLNDVLLKGLRTSMENFTAAG
ncbi:hypothetical protein QR680_009074 [Steinernema hermaphroditum]|uniref:Uncharacterized protein n=1 Tax=Steinernema hermaphroditum TaxID=289476 RepID=A0AA39M979_9BILA|nr:hypothetical protein QR680_009074 [Steinernema hermaphroditum]